MCQDLWQALVQGLGENRETQRVEDPPGKLLVPHLCPEWASVTVLGDGDPVMGKNREGPSLLQSSLRLI